MRPAPKFETVAARMAWVGSHKSPRKAKSSRRNGKLGGRPKKQVTIPAYIIAELA